MSEQPIMTPEAQRIAIAELLGIDVTDEACETATASPYRMDSVLDHLGVPDYLNDLNAMYEAEKVLTLEQCGTYVGLLCDIFDKNDVDTGKDAGYSLAHASASQRAEAFLKTVGRWL